jgi:MSHA biogenesis protein MshN
MSLLNDMLRDLDARRQNAPGSGVGAEKLIPATERAKASAAGLSGAMKVILSLGFGVLIAAVGLMLVLLFGGEPTAEPVPVATVAPVEEAPALPTPSPRQVAVQDSATAVELERLANRMQDLEEQNRALRARTNAQAASAVAITSATLPAPASTLASRESSSASVPQALPDATAPAPILVRATTAANTGAELQNDPSVSAAPIVSSVIRSPSDLSFRELDRLQVQQALTLWQQNQRGSALQSLREFSQSNIEAHQSREMLAKLLLQQGDSIEALSLADLGLRIAPDYNGYKKIKARILMGAGVSREAADLLSVRAPSLASDPEYHELQAASLLASKQFDEALILYEGLSEQSPDQSRWWYGRAASLDALGRGYEAAQSYERALRIGSLTSNLRQLSQERINAIRQN